MGKQWEIKKKDNEGNSYFIYVILSGDKLKIDNVDLKPKGKRKLIAIGNALDNKYRGYAVKDRGQAARDDILASVPNHFLMEALMEAWEELKPTEIRL